MAETLVELGATPDQAAFFLESAGGNIEAAVNLFLESQQQQPQAQQQQAQQQQAQQTQSEQPQPQPVVPPQPQRRPVLAGGFATIGSLAGAEDSGDESYSGGEDSGSESPQEYFAGGSKNSGVMVQGRGGRKQPRLPEQQQQQQQSTTFGGSAYKLGTEATGSTHVPAVTANIGVGGAGQPPRPQKNSIDLYVWKNGYSIDDGPLRPLNADFVQSLSRGEYPRELREEYGGQELQVAMHDKRGEEYVEPPKKLVPFSGAGQRLGDSSSASSAAAPAEAPQQQQQQQIQHTAPPSAASTLDASKPKTTVQIRLANGSVIKAEFNHDHRVADIRALIDASDMSGFSYALMTTFPPKKLDDSDTLADAGLLNSVVVQRRL